MNSKEHIYTNEPVAYTEGTSSIPNQYFFWRNRFHFLGWTILILNETLAAGLTMDFVKFLPNYIIYNTLHISLFYFHSLVILPQVFNTQSYKVGIAALTILIEIFTYILIAYLLKQILPQRTASIDRSGILFRAEFFFPTLWRCLYFLNLSTGLYFLLALQKTQLAKERSDKQILRQIIREKQAVIKLSHAKNAILQASINPHFLFNALNKLYAISRIQAPIVASGLILISKIMRFSLENGSDSGFVTIGEELKQVENLIEFGNIEQHLPIYLKVSCDEQANSKKLIPLILITLVENMLKHGDLSRQDKSAKLDISYHNEILMIVSENTVAKNDSSIGFHSGLDNIKARLSFEYEERVETNVMTRADIFEVRIIISN